MIIAKLLKNKNFILSAGMMRSGSTLLYNILRLCLQEKYGSDFKAGWIDDVKKPYNHQNYLIKTHSLDRKLTFCANKVFYSYRDIRACMASQAIKFKTAIDYDFCKAQIEQYQFVKKSGVTMISYEQLVHDKDSVIKAIAKIFKLDLDTRKITEQLPELKTSLHQSTGYDQETLLHHEHGTGLLESNWKHQIGEDLLKKIEIDFKWWFDEVGYKI